MALRSDEGSGLTEMISVVGSPRSRFLKDKSLAPGAIVSLFHKVKRDLA